MSEVRGFAPAQQMVSNTSDLLMNTHDLNIISGTMSTTVRDVKTANDIAVVSASTFIRCGLLLVRKINGELVLFDSTSLDAEVSNSAEVYVLYENVNLLPHIANGDALVPVRLIRSGSVKGWRLFGDLAGFNHEKAQRLRIEKIAPV